MQMRETVVSEEDECHFDEADFIVCHDFMDACFYERREGGQCCRKDVSVNVCGTEWDFCRYYLRLHVSGLVAFVG